MIKTWELATYWWVLDDFSSFFLDFYMMSGTSGLILLILPRGAAGKIQTLFGMFPFVCAKSALELQYLVHTPFWRLNILHFFALHHLSVWPNMASWEIPEMENWIGKPTANGGFSSAMMTRGMSRNVPHMPRHFSSNSPVKLQLRLPPHPGALQPQPPERMLSSQLWLSKRSRDRTLSTVMVIMVKNGRSNILQTCGSIMMRCICSIATPEQKEHSRPFQRYPMFSRPTLSRKHLPPKETGEIPTENSHYSSILLFVLLISPQGPRDDDAFAAARATEPISWGDCCMVAATSAAWARWRDLDTSWGYPFPLLYNGKRMK